ncbi:hypothetical protein KBA39_07715 [Myxococcota bacterium]|nr:hypothetical protein [Myxococcota bacterium]
MRGVFRKVALVLGLLVAVAVAAEGLAGFVRMTIRIVSTRAVAEQYSCDYDEQLGWVSKPGFSDDDFFGPGRSLNTNRQGFRNRAEILKTVPDGRVRVLCSGDSFTLGYGVRDDATWCARLESIEPRIESVNIGQGGYGIDQSYLRSKQVRAAIDTDVQILAFNCFGFELMRVSNMQGYGKPMLGMDGDRLITLNQPVPRSLPLSPNLSRALMGIHELNLVSLMKDLVGHRADERMGVMDQDTLLKVVEATFNDVDKDMKSAGGLFVLVKMPVPADLDASCPLWTDVVEMAARNGWHLIDIPVSGWPANGMDTQLYLDGNDFRFRGAGGHLNEDGNNLVARIVIDGLMKMPEFVSIIEGGQPLQ